MQSIKHYIYVYDILWYSQSICCILKKLKHSLCIHTYHTVCPVGTVGLVPRTLADHEIPQRPSFVLECCSWRSGCGCNPRLRAVRWDLGWDLPVDSHIFCWTTGTNCPEWRSSSPVWVRSVWGRRTGSAASTTVAN